MVVYLTYTHISFTKASSMTKPKVTGAAITRHLRKASVMKDKAESKTVSVIEIQEIACSKDKSKESFKK